MVPHWWRAAIGILFSSPRQAQQSSTPLAEAKSRESGPKRSGSDMASIRSKYPTSSRFVAIHPTNCRARWELARSAPQNWCGDTGRLMASLPPVSSKVRRRCSVSIDSSRRWMQLRRCPRWPIRRPPGVQHRTSRAVGGSISWRTVWRRMHNLVIRNVSKGRRADLQGSRRERPESAGDQAFGITGYRLIFRPKRRFALYT